jgi:hypothetical protein
MRYALSLRSWHQDMPASAIVEAVALPPDVHATAGQPRQLPRKGKVGAISRQSYALFRLGKGDAAGLVHRLTDALEHLERRRDALAHLRAAGTSFEFFVGLFLEGNEGVEFDPAVLGRIAALDIRLALDIYPPDSPASDASPAAS